MRAYARSSAAQYFTYDADSDTLIDKDRMRWQISDEALLGPDGTGVPRLPG